MAARSRVQSPRGSRGRVNHTPGSRRLVQTPLPAGRSRIAADPQRRTAGRTTASHSAERRRVELWRARCRLSARSREL